MHASIEGRPEGLAPDQRAAATPPPAPVLCVARAGSGKTTTLVARIAWLVDGGVDPATIAAITFNKRAAGSGPTEAQRLVRDVYSALADMEMERAPAGKLRPATAQTIGRSSLERLSSALARPQAIFARVDRVM